MDFQDSILRVFDPVVLGLPAESITFLVLSGYPDKYIILRNMVCTIAVEWQSVESSKKIKLS